MKEMVHSNRFWILCFLAGVILQGALGATLGWMCAGKAEHPTKPEWRIELILSAQAELLPQKAATTKPNTLGG